MGGGGKKKGKRKKVEMEKLYIYIHIQRLYKLSKKKFIYVHVLLFFIPHAATHVSTKAKLGINIA